MASFYKPYISDESESDSDSDGYTSEESLLNVAGKRPPISAGGPESPFKNTIITKDSSTKFETQASNNTSLFMINSRDRDANVYPQPTFFTIRLPKVYKSVKQINITQLNLLNSFFNFSASAGNTMMYVYEQGRIVTDLTTGTDISNAVKISIRTGTYTTDTLVTEITNALNATPLFADITLADFIGGFQSSGDYSPNFNAPGEVVFNSLTQSYSYNQTTADIVSRYFQSNTLGVGTVSYSYNQCLVAYYYPIVKEMIIAQQEPIPFSVVGQEVPPGFESWYYYIVFAYTGLSDPYITNIVKDPGNQVIFDAYRLQNTFQYSLVNKYNCTYNTQQGRLVINAPSLNQSIQTDLSNQYNIYLNQLISSNFGGIDTFNDQYNQIQSSNAILIELYNFIQSRFSSNFGINFGTYSAEFFSNANNQISIYNINNRYGWNLALTPGVSESTISSNLPAEQVPNNWPNIDIPQSKFNMGGQYVTYPFVSTYTVPAFSGNELSFSNAGENQFGYADIFFPLHATQYARTVFTSRCRQDISIMTLPRPLSNRGPGTEEVYNLGSTLTQTPLLFDTTLLPNTYILTDVSGNLSFNMYTVNQSMFKSPDYMRSLDEWIANMTPQILAGQRVQPGTPSYGARPPAIDISLTTYRPYIFFQINADKYLVEPNALFNISFYVETQDGSTFPVPLVITWYKDRAAFMADIENDLKGNFEENYRHFFKQETIAAGVSTYNMVVPTLNNQQTYMMIHTQDRNNVPSSIPLRVFCTLTGIYGDYTLATQADRLDMPFRLPAIVDQLTPNNAVFQDPTTTIYDPAIFQLGYDINKVSNNLLDYIVQGTNNNYYDPINITDFLNGTSTGLRYLFNLSNGGAGQPAPNISSPTTWSLYFGSNSQNTLRDTYNITNQVYLSSLQVPLPLGSNRANESVLVNWFQPGNPLYFQGTNSIYERFFTPAIDNTWETQISTGSIFLPCINASNARLFTDVFPKQDNNFSTIQDISGVSGMSFFLPPNQVVKLDSFLVKFAYTQPSADQNLNDFTRVTSPTIYNGQVFTNNFYRNRATEIQTSKSPAADWDDWYLYNRRNTKLAFFNTSDVAGASTSMLSLSSAIVTMTLNEIVQVNSFQYQPGSSRTREPEWATYYSYIFDPQSNSLWDVNQINGPAYWRSTLVPADYAPTYTAADSNYPNYFLSPPEIFNYTFLPRSFGVASAVGNAVYSSTISTFASDIPNSLTAVPFYNDPVTNTWRVGSFYALSFTDQPVLPSTSLAGAAPYAGPVGGYAWNIQPDSTIQRLDSTMGAMFYWNTKLHYEALDLQYNPATDLTIFGGYDGIANEAQDTMLFFYKNQTSDADLNDITGVSPFDYTTYVWGQEQNTNYIATDDQSGYNYLSYLYSVPVTHSVEYATHVRAYDPIPMFQTGIRFIGKNYTDFGKPTLGDIADEISSLKGYTPITDVQAAGFLDNLYSTNLTTYVGNPIWQPYTQAISTNNAIRLSPGNYFSHEYADALITFDKLFSTSVTLGNSFGTQGSTFNFSGYGDTLNQYINLYSTTTQAYVIYTTVLSTATGQLNEYVIQRYGNILPANVLNRNKITDPIPFQFLFLSKLQQPYLSYYDQWGLGWNMGFKKQDTTPPRTTITSDTFIRIVQDYIYLRLNPEYDLNELGVSGKEDLAMCQDSAGQGAKYFSKIILNDFASYCRTAIQAPKNFNPALGKFDKLSCQLIDRNGNQISNVDCEYDFVLEVTEILSGPKADASLLATTADLSLFK
jgi:hypothetical protein